MIEKREDAIAPIEASFDASRRNFLRNSSLLGCAGLSLGIPIAGCRSESDTDPVLNTEQFSPSIWLSINVDNSVIISITEAEMGQGILTSLPMLIAEELDLDWQQIRVQQAPIEPEYGYQLTGGSTSIRKAWQPLREAGATARQGLLEAAAHTWQAPIDQCLTESGKVSWPQGKRSACYGDLALLASSRALPSNVALKRAESYRIIGHPQLRIDLEDKTSGKALFGIDANPPGMQVAVIVRPPRLGETVALVNSEAALEIDGVVKVINLGSGVAVIAEGYWQAQLGKQALDIQWQATNQRINSAEIEQNMVDQLDGPAELAWKRGNAEPLNGKNSDENELYEAIYRLPLQAHATMEPMNCTAWFHNGLCEVWVPTQAPTRVRDLVADMASSGVERYWQKLELRVSGKRSDPVLIHNTLMGGGFGRRSEVDYAQDAVAIALQVDYPVKLIYNRGDDFSSDYFRPASVQRLRATLNGRGLPNRWHHRLVSSRPSTSGAKRIPYSIDDVLVDQQLVETPHLRDGYWRSVAHSYTAFAVESFIDELAHASNADPLTYRLELLPTASRNRRVLEAVAQMANWHNSTDSRYLGIAGHEAFGSYTAQVVELVTQPDGGLKLTSVFCAIDCGQVIDPNMVKAQLEGSIIYALTSAIKSSITIKDNIVEQQDFIDFPLLSFAETPEITVRLIESHASPGGVGESGVPPLLPALANALFVATGERYRSFPVAELKLSSGRGEVQALSTDSLNTN